MITFASRIPQLANIVLFILTKSSFAAANIDTLFSDTIKGNNFTVNLPMFYAVFTPSGNLKDITAGYKQKHRSALRRSFTSGKTALLLQLFPEYDSSPFYMTTEQSSDNSVNKVIFTSDTHSITWQFYKNSYVFDVEANSHALSETLFISCSKITDKEHQYSALAIDNNNVKHLEENNPVNTIQKGQHWVGIRDRFWAFLVRPAIKIRYIYSGGNYIQIRASDSIPAISVSFTVYAGPITMETLHKAGRECTYLLYPLWFWMRWLSIALLYLFDTILYITGNSVLSIVLLSICVKIIIIPLYSIAERWQNEVNRKRSILEPHLLKINKQYKGEERVKMTLALHGELGISPLYALKSLLSASIQIPIFFAAYHMLSEHIAFAGVSFVWINDLAFPDRLIRLPFTIPLLGGYINIFPFIMTFISIISSFVYSDKTVSVRSHKKQQRSLFFMAAVFFILLYTSPAAMLLYWTMNNILSLIESLYTVIKQKKNRG